MAETVVTGAKPPIGKPGSYMSKDEYRQAKFPPPARTSPALRRPGRFGLVIPLAMVYLPQAVYPAVGLYAASSK